MEKIFNKMFVILHKGVRKTILYTKVHILLKYNDNSSDPEQMRSLPQKHSKNIYTHFSQCTPRNITLI